VPRAALLRDGDRRFVYVYEDGRARRRDVTVGLLGLNEAEVASGLRENERVILPGATALSDGLRRPPRARLTPCSTARSSAWPWTDSGSTRSRRP
jgi:hypothetical protein